MKYKILVKGTLRGYLKEQRFDLTTEDQNAVSAFINEVIKANPGFILSSVSVRRK